MSASQLLFVRDYAGFNTYGLQQTNYKQNCLLATSVAQTFTVPGGSSEWLAIFSFPAGVNVWVAFNATATLPGASPANTASELNPAAILVSANSTISFITSDVNGAEIGVKYYART